MEYSTYCQNEKRDRILEAALSELLNVEGDFSDHRFDPGGKTRFGITETVARKWGYTEGMRNLPKSTARAIYYDRYWKPSGAMDLARHYPQLAFELFEFGVNAGIEESVMALQQIGNAANRQARDWEEIGEDGVWGEETEGMVSAVHHTRGNEGIAVLEKGVDARQFSHYFSLARQNPERWESFFYGWVARRIGTDIEV